MGPERKLSEYLKAVANEPFKWGSHDCLTFTNGAWKAMYGYGWADDWLGRYMKATEYGDRPLRPDQLRAEFGYFAFSKAVDERLQRAGPIPPRGALVATKKVERMAIGYGLGICVGSKAAFLSRSGVVYSSITDIAKAWVQNEV